MCRRVVEQEVVGCAEHFSTKTRGLGEPENPQTWVFWTASLCMRRHSEEDEEGKQKWNQRQWELTDGEMWTDVCSRQIERSVCLLNPPCRERTAQLPRGLSWSDPVACMETPNSVTSFVYCMPPPPDSALPPPPLHHHYWPGFDWLLPAVSTQSHTDGSAGCWLSSEGERCSRAPVDDVSADDSLLFTGRKTH